jgi:hypothetical protein
VSVNAPVNSKSSIASVNKFAILSPHLSTDDLEDDSDATPPVPTNSASLPRTQIKIKTPK